jgi:hypothetical protein
MMPVLNIIIVIITGVIVLTIVEIALSMTVG